MTEHRLTITAAGAPEPVIVTVYGATDADMSRFKIDRGPVRIVVERVERRGTSL